MKEDVIIVGSGQAGIPLATRLARAGKRVVIVERADPGGTCLNYGCTPTKTMIASARAAHVARTSRRLGVQVGEVSVDLGAIVDRKDGLVRSWREELLRRLRSAGEHLTLLQGHARFVGDRELEVNGERHRAEVVILNVGARPAVPPLPGIDAVPWLDNRRAMEARSIPSHLLILGGGYVGCEFGQMFRRFGAKVTIIDQVEHLLSREDPEISAEIEAVFRNEGIGLELGTRVEWVGKEGEAILLRLSSGKDVRGSHLLVATGRRPNTDDLGCEAAGVRLDPRGFIVIDDCYRTSAPGVYAVGDATGEPQFTHVAWDDHRILFDLLLGRSKRGRGGRIIPYTVFTDPQVAGVGLTEKEVRERGIEYETATMPFGHIARAIEVDEPAGMMKVLFDPKAERIIGAAIVGAEAGELIHVFVTLMQAQASPRAIVDAEFVHPTFAEGLQSLVMKLKRFTLSG
jgi:pyruvate/2-oxoglutarate dehydrogenase complex dihydrolipoamide dehydrogenase (E3) component